MDSEGSGGKGSGGKGSGGGWIVRGRVVGMGG